MPFFTDKFISPLSRKNRQNYSLSKENAGKEIHTVKLHLDGLHSEFHNGQWVTDGNDASSNSKDDELQDLIIRLKEEINLLKLKNEILLDMLAEGGVAEPLI